MAVDYFLKIDGIEGESQDARHKNEIAVESFSWGATQVAAPATGGTTAGKVSIQDFHFAARLSKASPKLFLSCATGQRVRSAVLSGRRAGANQAEFLKWTFTDVMVTSYQTGGAASGDEAPMDQVSLSAARIDVSYQQQLPDGTLAAPVRAGWDVRTNRPV